MVLEKQLGHGCTWIDLDLGKLNKLEDLSEIYGLDKETIEYALIETSAPTWTTTVKVGRLPLSIMS